MRSFKPLLLALLIAHGALPREAAAGSAPDDVMQLARAYAQAHPQERAVQGGSLVDAYADAFFRGFLTGGDASSRQNVFNEAYRRGAARWREGPEAQQRTFTGYGYTRVELTGSWHSAFETSLFEANGLDGACWLDFLPSTQSDLPKGENFSTAATRRIRVVGYLSPRGHYGHLSAYGRELYAQTVKILAD